MDINILGSSVKEERVKQFFQDNKGSIKYPIHGIEIDEDDCNEKYEIELSLKIQFQGGDFGMIQSLYIENFEFRLTKLYYNQFEMIVIFKSFDNIPFHYFD